MYVASVRPRYLIRAEESECAAQHTEGDDSGGQRGPKERGRRPNEKKNAINSENTFKVNCVICTNVGSRWSAYYEI